ncbi:MAG: TonB-dependent receptor, partial [Syntrophothermus sp.]
MKKINSNIFKLMLIIFMLGARILPAGTTGKISGKVTDASTNEPLVGVTIVVEGKTLGAVTDLEGEYYILNVPPGVYTLKASMVGYKTEAVSQVRVQVDLTTKMNFTLSSTAVQLGQDVMVVAKKEIQKDLTSSERSMQADQIQELPVRDLNSMLSMQAGITKDDGGGIHIRGGRSSEISYMVDGVQVMNPMNRSNGINIDDQSIEELKAITGTFNAEYGQALSGVVNIVTKKGSDRFTVNATAYVGAPYSTDEQHYSYMNNMEWAQDVARTLVSKSGGPLANPDYFRKYGINSRDELYNAIMTDNKPWQPYKSYMNSYNPFKRTDLRVNMSGPVPLMEKRMSFYVAGSTRYDPSTNYSRRYFMPWGIWQPVMDTVHTFQMPDGAVVPTSWSKGYNVDAKLFLNLDDVDLSYGIYWNKSNGYGNYSKYIVEGGNNWFSNVYTQILSATYVASKSTFVDFKGSYYVNMSKGYAYEDPYDYRYMPTNVGDWQQYMFRPDRTSDFRVSNNNNDYGFWGNNAGRYGNYNKYLSFNVDITSQINKNNMVKMGASGRFHELAQDSYTLQFDPVTYRPVIPDGQSAYHTNYRAKPQEFAAYIQDKMEFDELIINFGLRFDYFYSDGNMLADPMDPQIYSPFKMEHIYKNYDPSLKEDQLIPYTAEERGAFWWKKPDAKYQFSPRFGLSFPITAEGVIHFSYGHFFQNPELWQLYTNPNFWITGAGAQNLVGNANLNAERTVMYEIGLQQQMMNNLFLNVTAYYRDIRDWVGTGSPVNTYRGTTYYTYVNKDHAIAKGITFSGNYRLDK